MPPWEQERIIALSSLLCESHRRLLGRPLITQANAKALYHAPFALIAHGAEADPVFCYANLTAQRLWEIPWEEFIAMPSRLSAEPMLREERQALLDRAREKGYIDDYRGIRISRTGKRFMIRETILWNLADEAGAVQGQAAMFSQWEWQ